MKLITMIVFLLFVVGAGLFFTIEAIDKALNQYGIFGGIAVFFVLFAAIWFFAHREENK